ncbi:MAG TPA: hypothetical protein VK203_22015 [Nostocaceae cyanobacterium]|nr:hypothetical protein [Nostocaceae cyanobacterium]
MLTHPKVSSTNLSTSTSISNSENQLFEELTDPTAEKISGGAISNPTTTDGTSEKPPISEGTTAGVPITANPSGAGLTPFYPPLPTPKLARLGHLKGGLQTSQ